MNRVLKTAERLQVSLFMRTFAAFNKPDEELYALPFYSVGHFFVQHRKKDIWAYHPLAVL